MDTDIDRIATFEERIELVSYFETKSNGLAFLKQAAWHFAKCELPYPMDHAKALIEAPTMQDTPRNRANGYTPYTTPAELFSRVCRARS